MPFSAVIETTTLNNRVVPLFPGDSKRISINIPPGTTILKGTVLGQITSAGNAVQTISDTGTITAGTFTISGTNPLTGEPFTTAAIAYNAAASAVATAVQNALGLTTVTGGGGALPGTDVTLTYSGALAGRPVPLMTINNAGLTGGTLAIANTTVGRSAGTYAAYTDGGTNGTGTDEARLIMEYTVTSLADGRVYVGSATDSPGEGLSACPAYFCGDFRTTDLTGLTAAAVADLGRLISGTVADGILRIG